MTTSPLPVLRRIVAAPVLLFLAGCASGGAAPAEVETTTRLEPLPSLPVETSAPVSAPLPGLAVSQISGAEGQARRITELDARGLDLRIVLQGLAEQFGMGFSIAPDVTGTVTKRLRDVTLEEALRDIIPQEYTYNTQGGVLRVSSIGLQSRIFTLDYVSLARFGTSSTVIQRRLTGANGQGGQAAVQTGGVGGGADVITSVSIADLWQEVRVALVALVFNASAQQTGAAPVAGGTTGQPGQGGAAGGPTAFSQSDELGQKLIINPMAGTILVETTPQKMQQIETFLETFESSVQRQVLIEAKIVEVSLDRSFEFGIDWAALQRVGNVDLTVGQTTPSGGGVQFTFGGGNQQITAMLRTLGTQGDVRVLSSPQTNAMNNQRAVFNVTRDEVFFAVNRQPILGPTGATIGFNTTIEPQQLAVGIVLDVLPQIGADNIVSMNIRPAITNVARVESIELDDGTEAHAPVIDRREVDTFARVRPGETVVIGGLMQTREETTRSGVPLLMNIPWLGNLFSKTTRSEVKSELVIFITPTIVAGQAPAGN